MISRRPEHKPGNRRHFYYPTMFLAVLLFSHFAYAQEERVPDIVEAMKARYYHGFTLPASRKCTPQDAVGGWVERAIVEAREKPETDAYEKEGSKYLAFGPYNTLLWQRSRFIPDLNLTGTPEQSKTQYIMTSAGMFYAYTDGKLVASRLCFVSTEPYKQYPKGLLMLAFPLEKNTPFSITLYGPVGN